MAKIDDITQDKIKRSAKIADVLEASGLRLRRSGSSWITDCPFHKEETAGGFVVNTRDNYYKCFSCGASGDPIKFLMEYEKMTFPDALRYLASMYNIYIDDTPAPKVTRTFVPRPPEPPRKIIFWPQDLVKEYTNKGRNNLTNWMLSLPMPANNHENLRLMLALYFVGTYHEEGVNKGWTVFPQVDMDMKVHDIKIMAYKPDGHRDKNRPAPWDASKTYSTDWMFSKWCRKGIYDRDKVKVQHCLFGLHLATLFKDAEVCLVESEKTAIICSAFSDPKTKIWMACGGKQGFTADMLDPLIKADRYIVVYPDVDGEQEWSEMMKAIGYYKMSMTGKMRPVEKGGLYNSTLDQPKADIADIMVRMMKGVEETEAEKVARQLGAPDKAKDIQYLMDKLDLQLD